MGAACFESLVVWQRAKALCLGVYEVTHAGSFATDFGLRDQLQRAAVSVMSNIAEGFERRSRKEFARFLTIALGSAAEVRSDLYLAQELGYLSAERAAELLRLSSEVKWMLVSLRRAQGS